MIIFDALRTFISADDSKDQSYKLKRKKKKILKEIKL